MTVGLILWSETSPNFKNVVREYMEGMVMNNEDTSEMFSFQEPLNLLSVLLKQKKKHTFNDDDNDDDDGRQ